MLSQLKHPALLEPGEASIELRAEIEKRARLLDAPQEEYFFNSLAGLVYLMSHVAANNITYANIHPKSFVVAEHCVKLKQVEEARPSSYLSPQELMRQP